MLAPLVLCWARSRPQGCSRLLEAPVEAGVGARVAYEGPWAV